MMGGLSGPVKTRGTCRVFLAAFALTGFSVSALAALASSSWQESSSFSVSLLADAFALALAFAKVESAFFFDAAFALASVLAFGSALAFDAAFALACVLAFGSALAFEPAFALAEGLGLPLDSSPCSWAASVFSSRRFLFLSSFFLLTSSFALFFFTFPLPSLSFLLPFLFLYSVFPFFFLFLFSSLPLFLFSSFPFPFPFPLPFLFLSSHTCSSPLPFLFLLEMCPSPSIFINTKPCVGGRVPAKTHLSSPKTRRRQRVLMTTYQVVSGQSYIFAQVMYYM